MADEPSEGVQRVLAAMDAMDAPDVHELPPEEARALREEFFANADPITDVGSVEDRTVPGPDGEIPVRVYAPDSDGPHPVVAFFHGGGFVLGDLDSHDAPCRVLASDADVVVVSVDYRRAPEHPFPAPVEDSYAVTEWLAANAGEVGGDPGRLAVAGDSAGGNLAAVVALAARDRDGPAVTHQALVYPVVDYRDRHYPSRVENAEGYFLTADSMAYFEDHYVPSWVHRPNPYLSPLAADSHADLPPATVVTCGFDPLRDEGVAYAEALESAGVSVSHHHFDDLIHGVMSMVVDPIDVPGGHEVLAAVSEDLRDALH
ncbi:MAG: alpha/beta hydrolase [Halobacterium sp.]